MRTQVLFFTRIFADVVGRFLPRLRWLVLDSPRPLLVVAFAYLACAHSATAHTPCAEAAAPRPLHTPCAEAAAPRQLRQLGNPGRHCFLLCLFSS
jgi:hypothetical protein